MAAQLRNDLNKQNTLPDSHLTDSDDPTASTKVPQSSQGRSKRKQPSTPIKKPKRTKFTLIVKPDCFSQGKGIFLTNDLNDLKGLPKEEGDHVIQEYMREPHLIDELKYDIRLYVLVLSCEPLKIFMFREGLVRFATKKYTPIENNSAKKELDNLLMHLTNYAVNKDEEDFIVPKGVNDDNAHKRSLKMVLERLRKEGQDTEKLMEQIKDIIVKTILPIQEDIRHNYRACQPSDIENQMCFEILGFDIILDKDCKPFLLEVNHAPSFATDTPLDYDIKKKLF